MSTTSFQALPGAFIASDGDTEMTVICCYDPSTGCPFTKSEFYRLVGWTEYADGHLSPVVLHDGKRVALEHVQHAYSAYSRTVDNTYVGTRRAPDYIKIGSVEEVERTW